MLIVNQLLQNNYGANPAQQPLAWQNELLQLLARYITQTPPKHLAVACVSCLWHTSAT